MGLAQSADIQMQDADGDDGEEEVQEDPQDERYLQVINDTGKPVEFTVLCHSKTDSGKWAWFPISPKKASRGVSYEVAAGDTMYLEHRGRKLSASRIRFWVRSADGEYNEYRQKDLWLVPEVDASGKHVYYADQMEAFPLRLSQ